MNKKKHPISLKRAMAALGLILVLNLACCGVMRTRQPPLPSWRAFRREMLDKYSCINRLSAGRGAFQLSVECYCGDISQEEKENLKSELKAFLSSEEFLAEYVPYVRENWTSSAESGLQEHLPDIGVYLAVGGSDDAEWMSEASYYKGGYRSDRILTIDNYQTWNDYDYE